MASCQTATKVGYQLLSDLKSRIAAVTRQLAPVTRVQKQALTRERLLDAAEELVTSGSIAGLSLRQLCTRAGFTLGAFYSNFADKEALLLAVMERHLSQRHRELETLMSRFPAAHMPGFGLEDALDTIVAWLTRPADRVRWAVLGLELRLHAVRTPAFAPQFDAAEHRVVTRFASLLGHLSARLSLHPAMSFEAIARGLIGFWYAQLVDRGEQTPEIAARVTLYAMLCKKEA